MTDQKICSALLVAFGLSLPVSSFAWNPTLSVLGNYTIMQNYDAVKSGAFDLQSRKVNFGLEFTNKFYVGNDYFIKTGLRTNPFKTTATGATQPTNITVPYQIVWVTGYRSIAVPVQFGKNFVTASGRKGDFYAGISAGILMPSSAGVGVWSGPSGSANPAEDTLTSRTPDPSNGLSSSFLATADFGASYQVFKKAPRFSMGFACSIQLNKTAPVSYQAVVSDNHGNATTYDMQHRQQFTNCGVSFNYTFGKLKASSEKGHMLPTNQGYNN